MKDHPGLRPLEGGGSALQVSTTTGTPLVSEQRGARSEGRIERSSGRCWPCDWSGRPARHSNGERNGGVCQRAELNALAASAPDGVYLKRSLEFPTGEQAVHHCIVGNSAALLLGKLHHTLGKL